MTVKELKEKIAEYPDDMVIMIPIGVNTKNEHIWKPLDLRQDGEELKLYGLIFSGFGDSPNRALKIAEELEKNAPKYFKNECEGVREEDL